MPNKSVLKAIADFWSDNYVNGGLCSLCGNSGFVDTTDTAISGSGIMPGRVNYCICPNGMALRAKSARIPLRGESPLRTRT